jgi:hypothetical protein
MTFKTTVTTPFHKDLDPGFISLLNTEEYKKLAYFKTQKNNFYIDHTEKINQENYTEVEKILELRDAEIATKISRILDKGKRRKIWIFYAVEFSNEFPLNDFFTKKITKCLVFIFCPDLPFLPGYYHMDTQKFLTEKHLKN